MSELSHVLELFEFVSIDNITEKSLKKAFKKKVLEVHPDKGGNSNNFDEILTAFVYLSETFQRINGGRLILQNVISPEKLRDLRPNELINSIFEEFDNEIFNKQFEETHKTENHGYKDWLKNTTDNLNIITGTYGSFPVSLPVQNPPTFNEKEFNIVFEESTKKNKPEPSAIILHPEAMAYMSNTTIGTSIIENNEGEYNSDIFTNPEYTDVFSAFTTTNTVTDKVTTFKENNKTLNDIINERNTEIKPFDNSEREAILIFEKNKIAEQTKHLEKIKDFFNYDTKCITQLENWPPEKYSNEAYRGFIINF
jgi:hypothetical protein